MNSLSRLRERAGERVFGSAAHAAFHQTLTRLKAISGDYRDSPSSPEIRESAREP